MGHTDGVMEPPETPETPTENRGEVTLLTWTLLAWGTHSRSLLLYRVPKKHRTAHRTASPR